MKIVIFGATGFIGKHVTHFFSNRGHQVIAADVRKNKDLKSLFLDADAVLNLGGTPIFSQRWTQQIKSSIYDSRSEGTHLIVEALKEAQAAGAKIQCFLCASAIGFYGPHYDEILDETSQTGSDFLARVCCEWESQAQIAQRALGIRTVLLRFGIVLGKEGGALPKMLPPFKLGLGGPLGSGKQWMSWIHIEDVLGLIELALQDNSISGPMNVTAPEPLPNKAFSKILAKVLHRPCLFSMPSLAAYAVFGEACEVLLNGQRVIPKVALNGKYKFKFSNAEEALRNLLN